MTTPAPSLISSSSIEAPQPLPASDLFALTDEQILEIEPAEGSPAASSNESAAEAEIRPAVGPTQSIGGLTPVPEPPRWLSDMMNDPQAGGEARDLWNGVQDARQEAAAYREIFAKPEEARTASERARALEDIDSAFFGGAGKSAQDVSAGREALAQRMLREDPAAFREMVFAGLRALESAGQNSGRENVAAKTGSGPSGNAEPDSRLNASAKTPSQNARLAEYRNFEKSANEDLERRVGSAIQRSLEQVLPNVAKNDATGSARSGHAVPLQQRLAAAVREDVESALKSDQQLGEQIGRVLSTRRFDEATRSQVVRLINDRAQQLVPIVARRVIQEWTQTAFAARREKDSIAAQRLPAQAGLSPAPGANSGAAQPRSLSTAPATSAKAVAADRAERDAGLTSRSTRPGRGVDYRLTDEQILDL